MTSRILLIRHGQSANNALPEHERVHDPGLTAVGARQAERVAKALQTMGISRVIASPFRRALQTAWPTFAQLKVPTEIWVEVHEQGGCYSGFHAGNIRGERGMTAAEIAAEFPGVACPEAIDEQGWWRNATRETEIEATQRVQAVLRRLQHEFREPGECVAIFTHADFKSLFCAAVDPTHRDGSPNNGSISHFRLANSLFILEQFNETEHLGDELLTV